MGKQALFTGAGVALVTPMHPDGSINFCKLEELVDRHIAGGSDAIIVKHPESVKTLTELVSALM